MYSNTFIYISDCTYAHTTGGCDNNGGAVDCRRWYSWYWAVDSSTIDFYYWWGDDAFYFYYLYTEPTVLMRYDGLEVNDDGEYCFICQVRL